MRKMIPLLLAAMLLSSPVLAFAQEYMIGIVERHNVGTDFANKAKIKCKGPNYTEMKSLNQLASDGWQVINVAQEATTSEMCIRILFEK